MPEQTDRLAEIQDRAAKALADRFAIPGEDAA